MNTALISPSFPTVVLYAASFILVMWTVVDVARLSAKSCVDYWFGHRAGWSLESSVRLSLFST